MTNSWNFFLPDYANLANNLENHATVESMDHIDYQLRCNAILFPEIIFFFISFDTTSTTLEKICFFLPSIWHMIEVQFDYQQDMVVVYHVNNNHLMNCVLNVYLCIVVLNAISIEITILLKSINRLGMIVDDSKILTILTSSIIHRMDFFVLSNNYYYTNYLKNHHHRLFCQHSDHMKRFETFFSHTLNIHQLFVIYTEKIVFFFCFWSWLTSNALAVFFLIFFWEKQIQSYILLKLRYTDDCTRINLIYCFFSSYVLFHSFGQFDDWETYSDY